MADTEVVTGIIVEESWTTLEQAASACRVEVAWLQRHMEAGLLPGSACSSGTWRLSGEALRRAQRMRRVERDFEAEPELAALVADLLEEIDALRRRLIAVGQVDA